MKKIEQDILTLGFIGVLLKEKGTSLEELLPDYDKEKLSNLHTQTFKDEYVIREKIAEFARESYGRIKKKFTQK